MESSLVFPEMFRKRAQRRLLVYLLIEEEVRRAYVVFIVHIVAEDTVYLFHRPLLYTFVVEEPPLRIALRITLQL